MLWFRWSFHLKFLRWTQQRCANCSKTAEESTKNIRRVNNMECIITMIRGPHWSGTDQRWNFHFKGGGVAQLLRDKNPQKVLLGGTKHIHDYLTLSYVPFLQKFERRNEKYQHFDSIGKLMQNETIFKVIWGKLCCFLLGYRNNEWFLKINFHDLVAWRHHWCTDNKVKGFNKFLKGTSLACSLQNSAALICS